MAPFVPPMLLGQKLRIGAVGMAPRVHLPWFHACVIEYRLTHHQHPFKVLIISHTWTILSLDLRRDHGALAWPLSDRLILGALLKGLLLKHIVHVQ